QQLPPWCVQRAAAEHRKKLANPAAQLLVELVGPAMGVLDQELAKLAAYVGEKPGIDADDVDKLVGRSRADTAFQIFDAIGSGRPTRWRSCTAGWRTATTRCSCSARSAGSCGSSRR